MSKSAAPYTSFAELLAAQVRNEFTASQQYAAIAVWFDGHDLPRLAALFDGQSVEERNHAMMIVRYCLDRDLPVQLPGLDEVRNTFEQPVDAITLALAQEKTVTTQMEALFRAARSEGDVLGEQFMLWFPQGAGRGSCRDEHAVDDLGASGRQLVPDRGPPRPGDRRGSCSGRRRSRRRGRPPLDD